MGRGAGLFDTVKTPRARVRDGEEPDLNAGHRARLRQRLLGSGAEGFLDHELLEYVLALAIPRRDTKPLAKQLLAEFGGLPSVLAAEPTALLRFPGMTEPAAAACKFVEACATRARQRAVIGRRLIDGWDALIDYLHAAQAHGIREIFRVIYLNARNFMIADEILGEGTVDQAPVYVREVMKRAMELGATAVVLVHNHPSGDPQPSRDDIALTKEIIAVGKVMGVQVHDHLVIGHSGHASLRQLGLI